MSSLGIRIAGVVVHHAKVVHCHPAYISTPWPFGTGEKSLPKSASSSCVKGAFSDGAWDGFINGAEGSHCGSVALWKPWGLGVFCKA
eukprot:4296394-Amphidinium_carterae.1